MAMLRFHLTPVRIVSSRTPPPPNVGEDSGEKGTLIHCWWECKLVQPPWKTIWRNFKKLNIVLPYDPAIPLVRDIPEDM
jgi:hypothetical protein